MWYWLSFELTGRTGPDERHGEAGRRTPAQRYRLRLRELPSTREDRGAPRIHASVEGVSVNLPRADELREKYADMTLSTMFPPKWRTVTDWRMAVTHTTSAVKGLTPIVNEVRFGAI